MTETRTPTPRPLVLIPCGAAKAATPMAAADLYTSSTFRMVLEAARSIVRPYGAGDECIFVVSAGHGLVALDQVVAPYDTKMGDADAVTPATIAAQAEALGIANHPSPCTFLPAKYLAAVEASGAWDPDTLVDAYVNSMGVGDHRGTAAATAKAEDRRTEIARQRGWAA